MAFTKFTRYFCLDRAGLVGEDGATHHGVFDIAYLNCIPNLIIAQKMKSSCEILCLRLQRFKSSHRHSLSERKRRKCELGTTFEKMEIER